MRTAIKFVIMASLAGALPAWSQGASTAAGQADGDQDRVLGGHRFLLSEFVPAPFITTDFSLLTSLGFASATVSGSTLSLGALSEGMRLQVALTDWLAVRAGASGLVLSGIDQDAALLFGAAVGSSFTAGATAGWRFDRLRVAGSLDIEEDQTYNFNILSAISNSVTASAVDASTLLTRSNTLTVAPGGQIAYGISPAFGVFGAVQLAYASTGTASDDTVQFAGGGGVSADLADYVHLPIGVLAAYDLLAEYPAGGGSGTTSHQISVGVYYTGGPHLQLGLEGRATLRKDLTIYEGVFGMRYFW